MLSGLHPLAPRLLRYGVLLTVLLSAGALLAQSPGLVRPARTLVTVSVEGEGGERLRTFTSRGQTFVLGHHGARYNVRVQNQGPERVEVVLAIDGRDAVSGQPTDLVRHRGYVVPGYGSVLVQGFRTSMESVAAFRFTDPSNSYTARMGTPGRVGFIQVAVFDERAREPGPIIQPPQDPPWSRRWLEERDRRRAPGGASPPATAPERSDTAGLRGEAEARAAGPRAAVEIQRSRRVPMDPGSNLGTEFGEQRSSRVFETDFDRASPSRPSQWVTIRYDDEQGLLARGIEVNPRPVVYATPPPPPWPPSGEPTPFAPPPPNPHRPWYASWDW
jgi:hypothetical protein